MLTAPSPQTDRVTYVVQGEFHISSDPVEVLSTVLGSCVAVCLYDAVARKGGMNHFLLPFGQETDGDRPVRYGLFAMEVLINGLLKNGCLKSRLEAKLFGGAKITAALRDIGGENAIFAKSYLADEGIPCKSESLGGTHARRIVFRPTSGHVRQLIVAACDIELPVAATVQANQQHSVAKIELF